MLENKNGLPVNSTWSMMGNKNGLPVNSTQSMLGKIMNDLNAHVDMKWNNQF
jgi:hypothetical protein